MNIPMIYYLEDNYFGRYMGDYASFALMGITQSEFEESIKNHYVRNVDVVETQDSFGIQYAAKVNVINQDHESISYLLTSDRNKVLYFESIDKLLNSLQEIGYNLPKAGLKLLSDFSDF